MSRLHSIYGKFLIVLLAFMPKAGANTFAEIESVHHGNGGFTYTVRFPVDPFWYSAMVSEISFASPGLAFAASFDPQTRTNFTSSKSSSRAYFTWTDYSRPQERPVSYKFEVQSTKQSYKTSEGATLLMDLTPKEWVSGGIYSINFVGYCNVPCLVACDEGESDGSPATNTFQVKLIDDVKIDELLVSDNQPSGLRFHWQSGSSTSATYLVQDSHDLVSWRDIAQVAGIRGDNTWQAPQTMSGRGPFFRIAILSSPLLNREASRATPQTPSAAKVTHMEQHPEFSEATFEAIPGTIYEVRHFDMRGELRERLSVTAKSTRQSVRLKPARIGAIQVLPVSVPTATPGSRN